MNRRNWLYVKIVIFVVGFFAMKRFAEDRTDGFTVASVVKNIPFNPAWDAPGQDDISSLLAQKFYFYGRGGQAYVFLGEDRKTILKLFKKSGPVFDSCKLAFDRLKKETGLLYLHLNTTHGQLPSVQIIDRLKITHTLSLDQTSFVVQKRAKLIHSKIAQEMAYGNVEGAKKAISSLVHYLANSAARGIRDSDGGLKRNYGYIGDFPVSVDVGSFVEDKRLQTSKAANKELARKTRRLKKWLTKNYPELAPHLEQELIIYSKDWKTESFAS